MAEEIEQAMFGRHVRQTGSAEKIRDPMRGPLGSLIAQLSKNCFKKRFPHRFLPSSGAPHLLHAACHSARYFFEIFIAHATCCWKSAYIVLEGLSLYAKQFIGWLLTYPNR
jgi:hypothetical protein